MPQTYLAVVRRCLGSPRRERWGRLPAVRRDVAGPQGRPWRLL